MVKLVDIARATNVSNAAVSYAFSSDPAKRAKLSPATRERILRTAERFNYRPSLTGRGFALRRSYNIALLMPLSCTRNMSAHYLGMFHGVSAGIAGSDYNLSVFFGCDEKFLGSVRNGRIDAVAVLARGQNPEVFKTLAALEIPIVFLNRPAPPECADAASCSSDYRSWLTGVLDDFEGNGIRSCTLYYRADRFGDREVKTLLEELCAAKSISCRSFSREEFSAPAKTSPVEGFVFCGSSPAILDFLRRSGEIPYVILSEMGSARRRGLTGGTVFSHDSETIGRSGVEMLLAELDRGGHPEEKRIPLLRDDGTAKASMIPEF